MKIELGGGGTRAKGDGFINVDIIGSADIRCNLSELDGQTNKLPFEDDSVDEVYSSHCLEHIDPYQGLLNEIVRVCHVDATVEIRVPHWGQSMAMCGGHRHTISEQQVWHWEEFPDDWWTGAKMLNNVDLEYVPSKWFARAKILYPLWLDEDIYRFVPDTCHELAFFFTVVNR